MNPGVYTHGECRVIKSIDNGLHHMSISHQTRLPTYEEMKTARYRFCPPDVTMAQLFPPMSEFVNVHPFCLHLWQVRD